MTVKCYSQDSSRIFCPISPTGCNAPSNQRTLCANGGTCNADGSCSCTTEWIGTVCESKKVYLWVWGVSVLFFVCLVRVCFRYLSPCLLVFRSKNSEAYRYGYGSQAHEALCTSEWVPRNIYNVDSTKKSRFSCTNIHKAGVDVCVCVWGGWGCGWRWGVGVWDVCVGVCVCCVCVRCKSRYFNNVGALRWTTIFPNRS